MACQIDLAQLPLLTGCPADNEWFLVGNAVGGLDPNGQYTLGYARRTWENIRICAASSVQFISSQFKIGQSGDIFGVGGTTAIIKNDNVLEDSVQLILGGNILPRNDDTQISYLLDYDEVNDQFTITLNQGALLGQTYILTYAYAT